MSRHFKSTSLNLPQISVIIITKDRPQQLLACLNRLAQNHYSSFEVIIVDQGNRHLTKSVLATTLVKVNYQYLCSKIAQKSHGLNLAVSLSQGDILAFTDDDCLVDFHWLEKIFTTFAKNPKIAGTLGQTKPFQPHLHINQICPSTFLKNTAKFITQPARHWQDIGFGNNMAFKKTVIQKLGGFKNWLGPGTKVQAAEDGEITLHALVKGHSLFYNPAIKVYHNRWLTSKENQTLELAYLSGEAACYSFYALQGYQFAHSVIRTHCKDVFFLFKRFFNRKHGFTEILHYLKHELTGLMIGSFFGIKAKLLQT